MKHKKNITYPLKDYYFITLSTKDRKNYFGKIENDKMILSKRGEIANFNWAGILNKFENVSLDEFIIMPNHIHAIVIFKNGTQRKTKADKILTDILDSFRNSVESEINRSFPKAKKFSWQKSTEIRAICSETELFDMRYYIDSNPIRWEMDPENLFRNQRLPVRNR